MSMLVLVFKVVSTRTKIDKQAVTTHSRRLLEQLIIHWYWRDKNVYRSVPDFASARSIGTWTCFIINDARTSAAAEPGESTGCHGPRLWCYHSGIISDFRPPPLNDSLLM